MQPEVILLVADESVDHNIIEYLRSLSIKIISIQESYPSITDSSVLQIANQHNALLLTEDKDFGEMVFKKQDKHPGILLLRSEGMTLPEKCSGVKTALFSHYQELLHTFSVLKNHKLRIQKKLL